ncbi:MAG: 2-hydroxyacyl-CoA dehydratase [Firmicutes bacterium]|nr:2-hydroxyacyl-CoA dehydratase [Bacillota bacterium]
MTWTERLKQYCSEHTGLLMGLDIGSTTAKIVVVEDGEILFQKYGRHFSQVRQKAVELTQEAEGFLKGRTFTASISGSAGLGLAKAAGLPFVQEVFATGQVVEVLEPATDVVVELGGEDAKVIFFRGGMDERMNGSCAGGTGAFIDQMATLLNVSVEKLDELALQHERIYPIASRCGVFAKSDIQPLLNQGAKKEDIAASVYQAVVDQTIAGLAQGRRIDGHVMFLGGPLYYCRGLRDRFQQTLKLSDEDAVFPEYGRFAVALGAAFYGTGQEARYTYEEWLSALQNAAGAATKTEHAKPLFENEAEYQEFLERHSRAKVPARELAGYQGKAYLGIDCGSTTTKLVLIDPEGTILYSYYGHNKGNPVDVVREQLSNIYAQADPGMTVAGSAVTGYGEELIQRAFHLDGGLVETMAHYSAARFFNPDVDFIMDIGGQDMKCLSIRNDSIDSIILNEACSSGCGSFIETFARALGYPIADFAKLGLFSRNPVDLGSRCTVFMNSSVKQAQKDGADVTDISAGLSMSIVKNALFKVLRVQSAKDLGEHIVVQGGTFLNDAVLRSFERELGAQVTRPAIAGLMGAFGAALFAKKLNVETSSTVGAEELKTFTHTSETVTCNGCTNHCPLTINTFFGDEKFVSGNKCERGGLLALGKKPETAARLPNLYRYKREKLLKLKADRGEGQYTIGIPMSLGIFELAPMWHTIFRRLGFRVEMTGFSDKRMYAKGQYTIPSDTACYPAKLMHGHVETLLEQDVDAIFYPCLTYNYHESNATDNFYNCPVVAYYSEVLNGNMDSLHECNTKFLFPYLAVNDKKQLAKGLYECLNGAFGGLSLAAVEGAVEAGHKAYEEWMADVRAEGAKALAWARQNGKRIMVLAGRPYHVDSGICQGMDQLIESLGFVIVSEDCVSNLVTPQKVNVLNQWVYHARLYNAAKYVGLHDDCQLVQLVSFGCGLDAITTDEVRAILERYGKLYTQIKIDEINNLGAAKIRLRSLVGALEEREAKWK